MMDTKLAQTINRNDPLEKAIDTALEQQQIPAITADFAMRVAAKAAMLPQPKRARKPHYARTVSILLAGLMVLALFVLAPHSQPTFASIGFDIEIAVTALLGTLAYCLTRAPKESL